MVPANHIINKKLSIGAATPTMTETKAGLLLGVRILRRANTIAIKLKSTLRTSKEALTIRPVFSKKEAGFSYSSTASIEKNALRQEILKAKSPLPLLNTTSSLLFKLSSF